jgi:lysophospholipid acyltransferase (LPLAT)-like uncharacterized protein
VTDDDPKNPPPRRKTRLKRRFKRALTRPLLSSVRLIVPALYGLYMRLVYLTSKVEHIDTDLLWWLRERYGGLVGIMWHQEVFMVAWSFRHYEGHTLASRSDFGDLITAMLERNGFIVFRGGSTHSRTRRAIVLPEMIRHMREFPGVAYGITCDGSNGPAYQVKEGAIRIAHATHKPMILSRTWCKRRIDLGGWDRAVIPLPFNHIVQAFAGPYFVPSDADDPEVLEAFRQHLENELLELTWWVHERVGDPPAEPRRGYPAGWAPCWKGELPELPFEAPAGHPGLSQERAEPVRPAARRRQAAAVARQQAAT